MTFFEDPLSYSAALSEYQNYNLFLQQSQAKLNLIGLQPNDTSTKMKMVRDSIGTEIDQTTDQVIHYTKACGKLFKLINQLDIQFEAKHRCFFGLYQKSLPQNEEFHRIQRLTTLRAKYSSIHSDLCAKLHSLSQTSDFIQQCEGVKRKMERLHLRLCLMNVSRTEALAG